MFKSLFSLLGQVVRLFSNNEQSEAEQLSEDNQEENAVQDSESDIGQSDDLLLAQAGIELEVEDVGILSGDWGNSIPQRASALFPQTLPALSTSEDSDDQHQPHSPEQILERATPSPDSLYEEARADLKPRTPHPKPDRPLPKSELPEPLPMVPTAPSSPHYSAQVQVGRLVKQDPEPPQVSNVPQRPPEVVHSGKKGRRRMIQSLDHHRIDLDRQGQLENSGREVQDLPPPPRGFHPSQSERAASYHDPKGDRGATSRVQFNDTLRQPGVFLESNPIPTGPINRGAEALIKQTSIHEMSAPALKPKPVRFKKGNYLRFWGNYSAQPSYLHFGSLIRSERFIQLLPVWYNELDELDAESREEWSHLEDESPLEGEADWRRLLNPTMSSPIDFLLHRDRAEQLSILPRS